jgi:hypothetical protein
MRNGRLVGTLCLLACGDDDGVPADGGPVIDAGPIIDAAPPSDAGADACGAACECTMETAVVSEDALGAFAPTALVWNGTGWAMAWGTDVPAMEGAEIFFVRMDVEGNAIGTPTRVTTAPRLSLVPSLVWTGTEYGVAWNDQRDPGTPSDAEIYFARIAADGTKIGEDLRVSNAAGQSFRPSLVWTGASYALTWNDDASGNHEIVFARITSEGALAGDPVAVTESKGSSLFSDLAASGAGYGVVWNDDRDGTTRLYLQILSEAGRPVGVARPISELEGGSYGGAIEWNGSSFGVTWTQEVGGVADDTEIYFARVADDGTAMGSPVRLRDEEGASDVSALAWNGSRWGVAWRDNRDDATAGEIYFVTVGDDGPAAAVNLSMDADDSAVPALVWNGSLFGLGWHSSSDAGAPQEKRFLRICPRGAG